MTTVSLLFILLHVITGMAEPVVIKGKWIPELIGKKIKSIRVCNTMWESIPFQIDEVTKDGEYVCYSGDEPNSSDGNGVLDSCDEIVFLKKDGVSCTDTTYQCMPEKHDETIWYPIYYKSDANMYKVLVATAQHIPLSKKQYITYEHRQQLLTTPGYYAQFAPNRFHFTRAGVWDTQMKQWIHLTHRLRIEILLKALWGLIPIRYSEDNLICYVKRYKTGPIRCIRRGDFHLRLGLGIKGSRAAVNQICYPKMVSVPVKVHVPIRFGRFFNEAWIELVPVISDAGNGFTFSVPECDISYPIRKNEVIKDTLFNCNPYGRMFVFSHDCNAYGWYLSTDMPRDALDESSYIVRPPEENSPGIARCGLRIAINEVQKGRYTISNRVLFPDNNCNNHSKLSQFITHPITVHTATYTGENLLFSRND